HGLCFDRHGEVTGSQMRTLETIATNALNSSDGSRTRLKDCSDLTKPRMNMVVVGTTFAGYFLSTPDAIDWLHLIITMAGTARAPAGASVLNQVMERDFDSLMPRTADRPIPAGRIRTPEACLFGLLLAVTGIVLLSIEVNLLTAFLGALTLVIYLFVYTP